VFDWLIDALCWVWEKLRGPRLRLELPFVPGEPEQHVLPIVQDNRWRVVFGLALRNEGRREARNWRVQKIAGSGWRYEVHAAGPSAARDGCGHSR
jgi:hypothetical protein